MILKEVWMKVVDHGECQSLLRKTKLGRFFTLDREAFMCAGGQKDVDMCTVRFSPQYSLSLTSHQYIP